MNVMDCLGSMIMAFNQWVLEVEWSTVMVSRTNPIKDRGEILQLTSPIFSGLCSIDAIAQTKCQNIKLKTPLQS